MRLSDIPHRGYKSIYKPTVIAGLAAIFAVFALQEKGIIQKPESNSNTTVTEKADTAAAMPDTLKTIHWSR